MYAPNFDSELKIRLNDSQSPLGSWQNKNWDPAVGSSSFDIFCTRLSTPPANSTSNVASLPYGHPKRKVSVALGNSTQSGSIKVDFALANYATYIKTVCTHFMHESTLNLTFVATRILSRAVAALWRRYVTSPTFCRILIIVFLLSALAHRTTLLINRLTFRRTGDSGNFKFVHSGHTLL